ncbi:MAG TPA: hypothetical protein DCF91_02910, partial [Porphyromonadaceae bacterium]|nr:hypothetical protein [Porphyromonadaceae bacterium]
MIDIFTNQTNQTIEVIQYPLFGVAETIIFTSEDRIKNYLGQDSVEVDIPSKIYDDKIYFDSKQVIYDYYQKQLPAPFNDISESCFFEPGKTTTTTFAEFRQT